MGVVIGVYNRKGGVGKTTCAINLATAFAIKKKKVLIIDGDSQCNATKFLLSENEDVFKDGVLNEGITTLYEAIVNKIDLAESAINVQYSVKKKINCKVDKKTVKKMSTIECKLSVLPGSKKMNDFGTIDPFAIKPLLDKASTAYDYVFIDFPPADDALTTAYLVGCDRVIVPLILAEEDSTDGYSDVIIKCRNIREQYGVKTLGIQGAFFNKTMMHKADQKAVYAMSMRPDVREALKLFKSCVKNDYGAMTASKDSRIPMALAAYGTEVSDGFMKLAKEMESQLKEEGLING